MFKTILLAIDNSAPSDRATTLAIDLARKYGARIILVHAFHPIPEYLGEPFHEEVTVKVLSRAREVGAAGQKRVAEAGIEVETDVLEGPPAEAILRVAEARKVDLIAMGSRGLSRLTEPLLGSVSHRVIHRAKVPVLIVH